jgi:folate-binding protein YgfZ
LCRKGKKATCMGMTKFCFLPGRGVLALTGADRVGFLNGLVSNDVAQAAPGRAVWAALLTAQGKWLADFFIFAEEGRLLLDCETAQAPMLLQRLQRYKLRADIALAHTGLGIYAAWGGAPPPLAVAGAPDPRLAAAGWRLLGPAGLPANDDEAAYDQHRLGLGLPDGSRDMEAEKTVLLEAGFDELNGISWTKGCYMGQELTARTRYRGLIKRRLLPVRADTVLPAPGTPVLSEGREIGQMRSSRGTIGLATLRLDALNAADIEAGGMRLAVIPPDWAKIPAIA